MEHYELTFIVSIRYAGETLEPIVKEVEEKITSLGGTITSTQDLGKMRFAYKIDHQNQGFYRCFEFDIDRSKLKELDKWLILKNEVLRHLVIKRDPMTPDEELHHKQLRETRTQKEAEYLAKKEKEDATEEKKAPRKKVEAKKEKSDTIKKEASKDSEKATEKKIADEKPAETKTTDDKPKASLDDLDKKIDEILDADIEV